MSDLDRGSRSCEDAVPPLSSAAQERERELVILSEVAARVHGEDDPQKILDIALEEILGRMGLRAAWVFMGDEDEKKLRLAASRGISPKYLDEVRRNGLGECLCPEVFGTGHRMQARNTTQCPRMPDIVAGLTAPAAHACIPLRFEAGVSGVLNVAAEPGGQFSDEQLRFLETLGHQVGLAVERARHREAQRRRDEEARALAAVTIAIGGSLDLEAVLRAVGNSAREVLQADRSTILLGSDATRLRVAHLSGLPHPELREGQTVDLAALGSRLQVRALAEKEAFFIEDGRRDARVSAEMARRWDAASGIVTPLFTSQRSFGLLVVTCAAPRRWRPEQFALAQAFAAQASVALENARLYDEARSAYRELKAAQDRVLHNEKMAVLGTFASGLAHEVRNPLNSIGLQLSILERRIGRVAGPLAKDMRELTDTIREEIRRLDGLVGDFLLFSRTDRLQHQTASVDALVDEVLNLMRPEAKAAGVTIRREKSGAPLPEFRMDAEKMKQVVMNLLRNAVEATPGGGTVVVETGGAGGQATLVVRDTGPGLPEGLDVFQLFVTTKAKGTGLGLSIVQQIVRQHGGEIAVESERGKGACFTVTLPTTEADPAREAEER